MTTKTPFRPLNKVEGLAIHDHAQDMREAVEEVVGQFTAEQRDEIEARIREYLTDQGPMLPKLLAAKFLESIRTGDKTAGEQDPPEDGMLGQWIDEYMGKVWPLVLSPKVTTEAFRKAILD